MLERDTIVRLYVEALANKYVCIECKWEQDLSNPKATILHIDALVNKQAYYEGLASAYLTVLGTDFTVCHHDVEVLINEKMAFRREGITHV